MNSKLVACLSAFAAACIVGSARGTIIVLKNGPVGSGQLISKNDQEVVFHSENAPKEVHLSMDRIARIIDVDEHGADKALAARVPPKWDLPAEPTAPPLIAPVAGPTYYLIPLHGEVGSTILASALEKSLADAVKRKPTVVVLDIDSPGGLVDEAKKITRVLHRYNKQLRIIALTDQDLSAAAILTLSVKEIYVKSSSTIGAATSYRPTQLTLPPKLEEKMQSAWRAVARNSAEEGGHEPMLAEAMIDNDLELHLDTVNGKPVIREGPGERTLCRKGKILTLSSHEAVACGLAADEADDLDELSKALKLDNWTECKGLGTLLAEYLPKRDREFKKVEEQTLAEFKQNCARAQQSAPSVETSRLLVQGQQRYVRIGNQMRLIQSVPPSVVTQTSHAHWHDNSLSCVVALQEAEGNLADAQALCKAFGQEGLADLINQVAVDIVATRARIFDDRNQYMTRPAAAPNAGPQGTAAGTASLPQRTSPAAQSVDDSSGAIAAQTSSGGGSELPMISGPPPVGAEMSQVISSATGGEEFTLASLTNQPVIGFEYRLFNWGYQTSIRSIEPIFDRSSADKLEAKRSIVAKPGYVVSGLKVQNNGGHTAIRVVFAKLQDGRLDSADSYLSNWIADDSGEKTQDLGDNKRPIIGIHGRHHNFIDALGVVFPAGAKAPPRDSQ